MKCSEIGFAVFLFGLGFFSGGCNSSASSVDSANSHQHEAGHSHEHPHSDDHPHSHEHPHSDDHPHSDEHPHSDDHPHSHDHPHGSPMHGGQIVGIGHSHHGNGQTHYHAEIMPLADGKIVFHVLTDDRHGESQPADVTMEKIRAYVDPLDQDSVQAVEVAFSATKNSGGSTFTAIIPEVLQNCKRLSVIVPKIELGGERLNFSFKASTTATPAQSEKTAAGDSK